MATNNPTIHDVIAARGLGRNGATLSIGIVLDGGTVGWGDCVYADPADANIARDEHLIAEQIKPLLVGQSAESLHQTLPALNNLTYDVTRNITVQPEAPAGISRRSLISALTANDTPKPITKAVTTTYSLVSGLRYGVSQALINAIARWRNLSPLTVISSLYDLEARSLTLPAHGEILNGKLAMIDRLVWEQVASIGYTPLTDGPAQRWGYRGERLQGFVGQLKNRIVEKCGDAPKPPIHLNLNGIYTELHENKPGKLLGALHGMRTSAEPCELRIVNPILSESADDLTAWRKLKDFMKLRKYDSPIGVSIKSLDAVSQWDKSLVDFVQVAPAQVGSLDHTIKIIQTAQAADLDVYIETVSAETPHSSNLATAIAIVTNAKQLLTATDDVRLHAYSQLQKLRQTPN